MSSPTRFYPLWHNDNIPVETSWQLSTCSVSVTEKTAANLHPGLMKTATNPCLGLTKTVANPHLDLTKSAANPHLGFTKTGALVFYFGAKRSSDYFQKIS